ncbi:hypothetical protein KKD03_01895 [Patescibacteria group bacterium]|nr:hypothetical protein [Patescibacteria group bacterium]
MNSFIIINFILNIFVFLVFIAGLGMGGSTNNAIRLYKIYALSLIAFPALTVFLLRIIKQGLYKKVLLFLSLTYFVWGYILVDIIRVPLEPIYNYDKYKIQEQIDVSVMNVDRVEGVTKDDRNIRITLSVVNNTKKTYRPYLDLVETPNIFLDHSSCSGFVDTSYNEIFPGENIITYNCSTSHSLPLSNLGGHLVLRRNPKTGIYFTLTK